MIYIYISQNAVFVSVLSTDIHGLSKWFPWVTRQIVSWIGPGGTISWPPWSPDLTPLYFSVWGYRGADKSLARPTSRCILFDGENISFDASLVIYINSTNFPPIMIINRIYENQNLVSL